MADGAYLYATQEVAVAENSGTRLDVLHIQTRHGRVAHDSIVGRLVCASVLLRLSIACAAAVWVRGAVAARLLLLLRVVLVRVAGIAGVLVVARHLDGCRGRSDARGEVE
jgi:hypothetical protein